MSDAGIAFNFVSALAFAGSAFLGISQVVPRPQLSDYFEVSHLTAKRVGDTAVIDFSREIKAPLHMGFTVRIMKPGHDGWVETCAMSSGVILYEPGRMLPEPLTLDWWTWGRCQTLPDGPVLIETTWAPEGGLAPLTMTMEIEG